MMEIRNSMRQMLRTPVKTVLFLLLIVLSVCLLSLGVNLRIENKESINEFEAGFTTIGTVRQIANTVENTAWWDSAIKENYNWGLPRYDAILPLSILDFDGADYIHRPEKRPFYAAYMPGFVIGAEAEYEAQRINQMERLWFKVIEVQPLEDCVPTQPVRVKVSRVLFGDMYDADEIWFCDHSEKDPPPMLAGKTYVMMVGTYPLSMHPEFGETMESEYIPGGWMESYQVDKDGRKIPGVTGTGRHWLEVTESNYDTQNGRYCLALAEGLNRYIFTIPVRPTNSTNLIMAFYDGYAAIEEGRDISEEEYASGERVCLVQRTFSNNNNLSVGDTLTLPLFCADYIGNMASAYPPGEWGFPRCSPVNAQGELYPIFDSGKYTIVGIYDSRSGAYESNEFNMGGNEVVIPAASVKNSDENNIVAYGPMQAYNTSFQIPNGSIDAFMEKWNEQGIMNLDIEFYDMGYSKLKGGLEAIKSVSIVLLLLGVASTLLILVFFTYMFISKQKKRTAIERSLGLGRVRCGLSLLAGLLLIVIIGSAIGSVIGVASIRAATNAIISTSQTEVFDTFFSAWVNTADKQADLTQVASSSDYAASIFVGLAVILAAMLFAIVGVLGNLKSEPLKLLSTRED